MTNPPKAPRRATGIRQVRDNPLTWEVRVSTGRDPVTGKYRERSESVQGNLTEAKRRRAEMLTEAARAKGSTAGMTVNQLLDEFLEDRARRGRSKGTLYLYANHANRHVRPGLGTRPVAKVERRDVNDLLSGLQDRRGLSPYTLRQVKTLLSSAFTYACQNDYRSTNPVTYVPLPPVPDTVPVCPTPEEVALLIRGATASFRPEMGRFFFLAATTGSRRGEMCGWRRSDLADGVLTIGRSILNVTGHTRTEKSTKTRKVRPVSVDPVSMGVLEAQLALGAQRAIDAQVDVCPDPYVFSDALDASVPWRPDLVTHYFTRLRTELGLEHLVLKGFRRFMTTYGQDLGFSLAVVALRAGHDPAVAARHYTGRIDASDRELATAVASLLPAPA